MTIQVNNLAEELQVNLDKVARDGSSGSGEEKEDFDDKKPMIPKDKPESKFQIVSLIHNTNRES